MATGMETLYGRPQSTTQLPTLSTQQVEAINQTLPLALTSLNKPTAAFEPIAQEARRGFEQRTVPTIAERFTSLTGGGNQGSSAYRNFLGQSAADFETQLAAQRAQFGQNQQQLGLNMLRTGLTPTFENIINPEQLGLIQPLLASLAGAGGQYLGNMPLQSALQQLLSNYGSNQGMQQPGAGFQFSERFPSAAQRFGPGAVGSGSNWRNSIDQAGNWIGGLSQFAHAVPGIGNVIGAAGGGLGALLKLIGMIGR